MTRDEFIESVHRWDCYKSSTEPIEHDLDALLQSERGRMESAIRELAKDEPWDLCAFEKAADVIREWGQ